MTTQSVKKSTKLSLEFDDYLASHPQAYKKIPNGAIVVVTSGTDGKLRSEAIEYIKTYSSKHTVIEAKKFDSRWLIKPLKISVVN